MPDQGRAGDGVKRHHWTETADRIYDDEKVYVAEDDRGDLWAPTPFGNYQRLNLWNPVHWHPYLISRFTGTLAWIEWVR